MAILLAFLTNLTLTSFICGFILELDINIRINKDMNIKKKMLERTVARQVFIFSYHNTSGDLSASLSFGSPTNRENRDETIRYI